MGLRWSPLDLWLPPLVELVLLEHQVQAGLRVLMVQQSPVLLELQVTAAGAVRVVSTRPVPPVLQKPAARVLPMLLSHRVLLILGRRLRDQEMKVEVPHQRQEVLANRDLKMHRRALSAHQVLLRVLPEGQLVVERRPVVALRQQRVRQLDLWVWSQ